MCTCCLSKWKCPDFSCSVCSENEITSSWQNVKFAGTVYARLWSGSLPLILPSLPKNLSPTLEGHFAGYVYAIQVNKFWFDFWGSVWSLFLSLKCKSKSCCLIFNIFWSSNSAPLFVSIDAYRRVSGNRPTTNPPQSWQNSFSTRLLNNSGNTV